MKLIAATTFILLCVSAATSALGLAQSRNPEGRSIPSVGCPTDSQTGPEDPTDVSPVSVQTPGQLAKQIAYFQSAGQLGEFGPTGWQCLARNGSYGGSVWIAPERSSIASAEITGPIVFVQAWALDTSGRLAAAPIVARLFPHNKRAKAFVAQIKREGLIPRRDFAVSPYATDRLHYLSKLVVEFSTPAGHRGVGTEKLFDPGHLLQPSHLPVRGIAALSFDGDQLIILRVRVPSNLAAVGREILKLERECLLEDTDCVN